MGSVCILTKENRVYVISKTSSVINKEVLQQVLTANEIDTSYSKDTIDI